MSKEAYIADILGLPLQAGQFLWRDDGHLSDQSTLLCTLGYDSEGATVVYRVKSRDCDCFLPKD